jgi:C-terminal processing protease CtpA/Prc
VQSIYPNSPADLGGLRISDEIIAINDMYLNSDMNEWLKYFENEVKKITFIRNAEIHVCLLHQLDAYFYINFDIQLCKERTEKQIKNLKLLGEDGIQL